MPTSTLEVDPAFEHGVLLDQGSVEVAGTALEVADLAFQAAGSDRLELVNRGESPARVLLLGGPPFPEQLVMWWNFVGRSHDDIVAVPADVAGPRRPLRRGGGLPRAGVTPARPAAAKCDVASAAQSRGIEEAMTTDKTGAPTTVTQEPDRFSIAVDGQKVGFAEFADRDGQRVFPHTEVLDEFGGRGLATILVDEALQATRDAGLRIVAVCPMVAGYVKKHHEFDDVVDPVDSDVKRWLANS